MMPPPHFRQRTPHIQCALAAAVLLFCAHARGAGPEPAGPTIVDPVVVTATRSVGDVNGRYLGPAATRNFLAGVSVNATF
jgi:hypothetical protein